jgi:phenylacetate-CoA ligase
VKNLELDQLLHIIDHAYHKAAAFKHIMDAAGLLPADIQTMDDLGKIPITSKDRLVELQQANPPFGGFLTHPLEELQHVFLSPGPIYEPHGGETAVMDTIREMLQVSGFGPEDIVLNTFGYHLIPTGIAVDQALREAGATVIAAGVGNIELQIEIMKKVGVTGYVGTPSWLSALIEKAEGRGFNFNQDFSLEKAMVSAEPLPPSLRQVFVEKYGLKVTNAYGTAELGFLAYNQEGGLAMRLLETNLIQVVDPDSGRSVGPGEVGEVVVTSFNETFPLIRLGTGDLAMNVDPAPGESRQGERSIILVGRVGDAVKVRGMFVHPNQLSFATGQVPGVARIQANVTRPENRDQLLLLVVPTDPSADREALTAALKQAIQASCRVKVDRVEFVSGEELEEGAVLIVDQRSWE